MAGTVKGLVVEIGGDTSGLQKALSKVNTATASLTKELKGINSLLKLDPSNTELLAQKQTVLKESIKATADKLQELKKAKEEADKQMEAGTEISKENYRALQREIELTQRKLSDLKNEASNWNKVGTTFEKLGTELQNIGKRLDDLGTKLTTSITAPITALATAGVLYDAQIEKYETAFQTFLGSSEEASRVIKNLKEDAKKSPFDTTSIVKANQMLISTGEDADKARDNIMALGEAVVATGGSNDELVRMSSNLQQIKNAGKATAMDIRQFAYAGIDVYGILADYTGKTTQEVKGMEISYEDLTGALKKASSEGGKYYGAIGRSSETLVGQVSALKSEFQEMIGELTKSLMPVAKKVVSTIRDVIKQFDKLDDSQKENIVRVGLLVAAVGPLLKIASNLINIIGSVSKGIGTITKAIGLAKNGIGEATGSAANLAKAFQTIVSPIGIAVGAITAEIGLISYAMHEQTAGVNKAFGNMGDSAKEFTDGIDTATSHLNSFNEELFTSSKEQQELEEEMQEVQNGITQICKTASDERRGYTQEEITQLDEYFTKLRELNQREIEIQQAIAGAITDQAVQNAKTFQGTLDEYKVQSQEWIKTATEQKDKTVELIKKQTIEEVALLNQRYSSEEDRQSEAYQTEYNKIIEHQNLKIQEANNEVGKINAVYAQGYLERSKQDDGFYNQLKNTLNEQEQLQENHNKQIEKILNGELWYVTDKASAIQGEHDQLAYHTLNNWNTMYKNMSEEQQKELGVWLAMVSQTELYGGQIDDETRNMVNGFVDNIDKMPEESKNIMKDTMQGMFNGMEAKEPTLFAKAKGIADGILGKLRKAFDIHSPSKETEKIFKFVMEGAEKGLEDEKKNLMKEIDEIGKMALGEFDTMTPNIAGIGQNVVDKTRTIFTTPQIVFNVQELDEEKLQQCFNYVNRKFGSAY